MELSRQIKEQARCLSVHGVIRQITGLVSSQPPIGYSAQVRYNIDIYSEGAFVGHFADVKPIGLRWPSPFLIRVPDITDEYEARCEGVIYGPNLYVSINEIPDWGPCDGTVPGGLTNPVEPGIGNGDTPIISPGGPLLPARVPAFYTDPLMRLLSRSSPQSLKVFAAALQAAGVTL